MYQIGTAISLLSPSDAMWRRAAYELQPPGVRDVLVMPHFLPVSVPSTAMIVWTAGFVLVVLTLALHRFARRAL